MNKKYPANAKLLVVGKNNRFRIKDGTEPGWFRNPAKPAFVPLNWRRRVLVPPSMGLEAWYLWHADLSKDGWLVWPQDVLSESANLDTVRPEIYDLRQQIYEARVADNSGQWRVSCAGLLKELAAAYGNEPRKKILVHREKDSISVWTLRAYESHCSAIPNEIDWPESTD